jgi:branched-chain amino acid transport system ATP-binding protein
MALSFDNIRVSYGRISAVEGISGSVPDGKILGVLGANGAGKSSLVNAITGRVAHTGEVTGPRGAMTGWPTWKRLSTGIGLVPQERALFGELTVAENITIGTLGLRPTAATRAVAAAFDDFPKLGPLRGRKVGHLSGGERQLTAIARALVRQPTVLILDEPSLGLSPTMRETVVASVLRKCQDDGLAVLLVEQFTDLVLRFANDLLVVANGTQVWSGPTGTVEADPIQH